MVLQNLNLLTELVQMEVVLCRLPKHSLLIKETHPMAQEEHCQAANPRVVLEECLVLNQLTMEVL